MTALGASAALFLFVMTTTLAAGYLFQNRIDSLSFESIGKPVVGSRSDTVLRWQLIAAGYLQPSALAFFYGVKCSAALGLGLLFWLLTLLTRGDLQASLAPALAGSLVGYLLPRFILGGMIRRRRLRLVRGLPAALDFCILSLEAGQVLDQALMETSRGLAHSCPELSVELEITFLEARTGNSRATALRKLAERTDEPEIRRIVMLLLDADRFGASIIPGLRTHAKYLRLRMRQQAQESARKVAVKLLFPVFFLIFPSVILVTLGPACIMLSNQMNVIQNTK